MTIPRFYRKRIYLDTKFNRKTQDTKDHWVGSSFKAFAVIGSSDSNFELTLTPDPVSNSVEGFPLREGVWHNFTTLPKDACFENATVQAGLWVDVLISTEDSLTSGKIESSLVSQSIAWDGSTSPQLKVTVGSVTSEICDADDERTYSHFQYKSGSDRIYIGTAAELADADYTNICHHILPGDDFEHRGTGALSAKSAGGDVVFSRMKGLK